ncbi:MAG: hypothetical protein WCT77_10730 [Bacteroidota bacterium]|jgi:hypothetical protein
MAEYPENFRYETSDSTLHWDAVTGAVEYQIEYTQDPLQISWQIVYSGGIDTFCSFDQISGTYSVKGKTRIKGPWGIYSPNENIDVP